MTDNSAQARWARLRALIEEALTLPVEQRLQFLRGAIPEPAMLAEAEQLLAFDRQASQMFSVTGWRDRAGSTMVEEPLAGATLGSYRIRHEIGRGGMGAVYLAERADGAYQQKVAIKLLQENLSTPEIQARFLVERQILAGLTHPGIVRLLDGGVTTTGRPYLVLEYVDGVAINRYCQDQQLELTARLQLFLKVADALQAAHQQLTLHLDLKPANILITADGEPHLLDFGIARLVGEGGTTQPSLLLMTPRFASPEQAEGKPLGVASDIFSLATLLYKLLTGVLPYPIEEATPLEAARMIREVSPLAPSQVTSGTTAARLRGDLDLILLKALRKEPERRYPTVAAFADDIRNYMSSRPVTAHGDSLGYRANRFVRRNWIAVTAAAVLAVGAAGSMTLILRSAREARRQQAIAQKRLQDVRGIAHSYIFDIDGKLQTIPGTLEVRTTVLQNARKYLEAMSAEFSDDESLMRELASGYAQIGHAQANPGYPSLRDWKTAEASQQKGLVIDREMLRRHPENTMDRLRLVGHLIGLSQTYELEDNLAERNRLDREAWEVAQPALDKKPESLMYLSLAITPLMMARPLIGDDDWTEANPLAGIEWLDKADKVLDRYGAVMPNGNPDLVYSEARNVIEYFRASVAKQVGDLQGAKLHFAKALERPLASTNGVSEDGVERSVKLHYAWLLMELGDVAGAEAMAPKAETARVHEDSNDVLRQSEQANEQLLLGQIAVHRGRVAEGLKTIDEGMATLERLHHDTPEDAIQAGNLSFEALRLGKDSQLPTDRRVTWLRRAEELALAAYKHQPAALRAALVAAQCEMELAQLDKAGLRAYVDAALKHLQAVLQVLPEQPEAKRLLPIAQSL